MLNILQIEVLDLRIVNSSCVDMVGFIKINDQDCILIDYKNATYIYSDKLGRDIDRSFYEDLLCADSVGSFVNYYIKPNFDYKRIL